jgi:hypothetical protein
MFIWTFLLRITHTIISQSISASSWITLYIPNYTLSHTGRQQLPLQYPTKSAVIWDAPFVVNIEMLFLYWAFTLRLSITSSQPCNIIILIFLKSSATVSSCKLWEISTSLSAHKSCADILNLFLTGHIELNMIIPVFLFNYILLNWSTPITFWFGPFQVNTLIIIICNFWSAWLGRFIWKRRNVITVENSAETDLQHLLINMQTQKTRMRNNCEKWHENWWLTVYFNGMWSLVKHVIIMQSI